MNEFFIFLIYLVSTTFSAPPGEAPDMSLGNAAAPGETPTDREARTSGTGTGLSLQKPDVGVGSADPSAIFRSAPSPPSPPFPESPQDSMPASIPASPAFSPAAEEPQPIAESAAATEPLPPPRSPILPVRHPEAPPILPFNPSAIPGPIGPDGGAGSAGPMANPDGQQGPQDGSNEQGSPQNTQPVEQSSPEDPAVQPALQPGQQTQRGMQERGPGGGPGGWGIADAERAGLIQGKDLDNSKEGSCSTCGPRNEFETPILERAKEQGVPNPAPGANPQQRPEEVVPQANKWPNPEPCDAIVDEFPSRRPPELAVKPDGYFKTAYKAPPPPPPRPFYRPHRKPKFGEITVEARDAIIETCRRIDCRTESLKAVEKYNEIHRTETDIQRIFNPFITPDQVHRRLAKIHKLKETLLDAAGLGEAVEPNNDGTFQDDILLTEGQTETMMLRLRQQAERNSRNKRAAIYVEQMPTNVWPPGQPIPVAFDSSLSDHERYDLKVALNSIESSTCIRFQHYTERPGSHHIYFVKVATPTFCGLSYIGKVSPANPIYLSFMCGDTVGVAIHEILHALGITHEHLRFDRDRYLHMEWDNINPQLYDYFAVADQTLYTTYGIPFDYSSIMLYGPFTGAVDHNRPAMRPVNDDGRKIQMMGQRKNLSERDVLLLNTMYCRPRDCIDQNVYCGLWALRKLCKDEPQSRWMQRHCKRSCGIC
ncbi:unnamed protein product [Bursaphelenchus xylophilus]|uniref:Metalloendopeptidase n=1 Tax=Bursaphelenchus xylophilus TaxID=6326 RepID=A0A1I7RK79_BURXY|nr:unnamed protein product [Bursaphelenchus xylophilus]CAG9131439.1 unnamed protein product [Bursaphelenchus xylophilus]